MPNKLNSTTTAALPYSPEEERANIATHLLGVVFSLTGMCAMGFFAFQYGDVWQQISLMIYGASLLLLYSASVLYHWSTSIDVKKKLRLFDHASIYILIAGTYSPFSLVNLRDDWGIPLLAVVWILAIAGIILKFFFIGAKKWMSAALYIGLGWLVVVAIDPVLKHVPREGLLWLLAGGIIYTSGVIFYVWKSLPYHHSIWHLFVLGGSACHFIAVMVSAVPFHF